MNPFGGRAPTQTVDRLLGKSYHVVKEVYLNLDLLKEIQKNEAINFFYSNWTTVENVTNNLEHIKNIGENVQEILKAPEYVEEVKAEGIRQIADIQIAKENAVSEFNVDIQDTVNSIKTYATSAAFSYRYCDTELNSYQTIALTHIHPVSQVKVGDHVVTPLGDVFRIEQLTQTQATFGSFITSIRGERGLTGETGNGLTLSGYVETEDELLSKFPVGNKGDAYMVEFVGDSDVETNHKHVFIWDVNTKSWRDIGQLQGVKGEPGASANDILMDPDPEEYFLQIYGVTSGDVIGPLIVNQPTVSPDPTVSFETYLL